MATVSKATLDEGISKLTKDLKKAAATLTTLEARFLVDSYYSLQESRIRTGHQISKMQEAREPHGVLGWLNEQSDRLEEEIKKALDVYSNSFVLGRWARSQYGIGPVIAAGLLAHIDVAQAKGVGAIWRYGGLDPSCTWGKGQKRPWNAELKTLCWKIGESFVKQSNRDDDFYGHLYLERKRYEIAKNVVGDYKDEAAKVLSRCPNHAQKATYQKGMLPEGHIHSRAKRWAVKLFLSHYFSVAWELRYGTPPPKPYILTIAGGHTHEVVTPNWPMQETIPPGLKDMP